MASEERGKTDFGKSGGVVLYFGKKKIDLKKLKGIISSRMGKIRNVKKSVDIVIIYAGKEFKVLRYK